jgi:glycosyltransferase involved in cell wall biosynthesis
MRIGVNCFSLHPQMGGLKQYFLSLFNQLLEHDRENTYVIFYSSQNEGELAELRSRHWRSSAVLLSDQMEVSGYYDLIDLYFCPFGYLWPRPLPMPAVVTLTDVQDAYYPEFFSSENLRSRLFHHPASSRMAERVITVSDYSKQTIVETQNVSSEKVTVAHLCADERYYRAAEIARRPWIPLPSGEFAFYPANRWPHKNHEVLLRALWILRKERNIKLDLVVTGYDPPGGYPLLSKAAEYGVGDQVHSAGYVSVEEVAWLYRQARMLVFPSRYEGFGIPLVEAMAAGCPVVCSRATSLPEIGGESARYFDPGCADELATSIEVVLKDGALRERMTSEGRERAAAFSPERMAAQHQRTFLEARESYTAGRHYLRRIQHQWLALGARQRYRRLVAKLSGRGRGIGGG